jgi:hypothetical protein
MIIRMIDAIKDDTNKYLDEFKENANKWVNKIRMTIQDMKMEFNDNKIRRMKQKRKRNSIKI